MTQDEWKADIVQRTLADDWPKDQLTREALMEGPCEQCGQFLTPVHQSVRTNSAIERQVPLVPRGRFWSCSCGERQALGELGWPGFVKTDRCDQCNTMIGYNWEAAGSGDYAAGTRFRITCKCGRYRTRI